MSDSKAPATAEKILYSGNRWSPSVSLESALYDIRKTVVEKHTSVLRLLTKYPTGDGYRAIRDALEPYGLADAFQERSDIVAPEQYNDRDTTKLQTELQIAFAQHYTPLTILKELQTKCPNDDGIISVEKIQSWFPSQEDQEAILGNIRGAEVQAQAQTVDSINWLEFSRRLMKKMCPDLSQGAQKWLKMEFQQDGAASARSDLLMASPVLQRTAPGPAPGSKDFSDHAAFLWSRSGTTTPVSAALDIRFTKPVECLHFINDLNPPPAVSAQLILSYFSAHSEKNYENDRNTHVMFAAYIWQHQPLLEAILAIPEGKKWFESLMRHHDFRCLYVKFNGDSHASFAKYAEYQEPVAKAQSFSMHDTRRNMQSFDIFLFTSACAILGDRERLFSLSNNTGIFFACVLGVLLFSSMVQFFVEYKTTSEESDALERLSLNKGVMWSEAEPTRDALLAKVMKKASKGESSGSEDSVPVAASAATDPLLQTPQDSKQTWRPFAKVKQSDSKSILFARSLVAGGVGLNLMTRLQPNTPLSPLFGMIAGSVLLMAGVIIEKYITYNYRKQSPRFDKNTLKASNSASIGSILALGGTMGLSAAIYCMPNLRTTGNISDLSLAFGVVGMVLCMALMGCMTTEWWAPKDAAVHTPNSLPISGSGDS